MKKLLVVVIGLILLAGCSKNTQFTQDLTGTWYIYKLTYFSVQVPLSTDSISNSYTVTYSSNGQYVEQNVYGVDTVYSPGSWHFQNNNGQLVMTPDSAKVQTTYTVFNLTGNSVELLNNGYDRYMRKLQ